MTASELVDEFESELRRYASGLARDSEWADDLVQETFIRALGYLALFDTLNMYQKRAWLKRTLKNLFLDGLRSNRRKEELAEQLGGKEETPPEPTPTFHEILEIVPERYRGVLHQHYVLGMNSQEIARDLGIPAATVRSRLHLAVRWLRDHRTELE